MTLEFTVDENNKTTIVRLADMYMMKFLTTDLIYFHCCDNKLTYEWFSLIRGLATVYLFFYFVLLI